MTREPSTRRPGKCPVCGKPPAVRYRPFCSPRCADVDLGRWLGEAYRVPGDAPQAVAGSPSPEDDDEE